MLIIHYHIFKNAGTSVDTMLQRNFGSLWTEGEFPPAPSGYASNASVVEAFLSQRPELLAFSSHTAQLPLPQLGKRVFPIFFLRHPLDRLKSAYLFERMQDADTHGARLAKTCDFEGYVRALLAGPPVRQARNFQTERLAGSEAPQGSERDRAMRMLESLPFVGLVEAYDRSLERLGEWLAPHFPNFQTFSLHENRTAGQEGDLQERLAAIEASLPTELYENLVKSNADDFAIYDKVRARYL
jgi:hypothetical protein